MNEALIEKAWDDRANISPETGGELREAVEAALSALHPQAAFQF